MVQIPNFRLKLIFIFLGILALAPKQASAFWVETNLQDPNNNSQFQIISGEINTEEDKAALQNLFKEKAKKALALNSEAYLEVNDFTLSEQTREPGQVKSKKNAPWAQLKKDLNHNLHTLKIRSPISVFKKPKKLDDWLKDSNHKMQLSFAIVAANVDGVTTTIALTLFQGLDLPGALLVGGTVATLSGTWSLLTPQIALFLNGDPSLVGQIIKKKGAFQTASKWVEGLFKWGIIQSVFLGVITGVSSATGAMEFHSLAHWAQEVVSTAGLVTAGQGVFDYSLSVEIDRSVHGEPDPLKRKKTLLNTYILGTAAASTAAIGGIASIMGADFGDVLLYGLFSGGVFNLARIQKTEIKSFFDRASNHCKNLLKPTPGSIYSSANQAHWGAE